MKHTTEYTQQLLLIIGFLNGLCFYAPVALLVRTQNGISISQFFTLQMILSIGIFISEVPAGWLSDRIGYKRTLVLSQSFLLFARILLLVSKSYWFFALEALVEALSISLSSGTESAYVYSCCQGKHYALLNSRINRAGTIGFLLSTVSYSLILPFFGISGLVALTCVATLLSLLATLLLPMEKNFTPPEKSIPHSGLLPKSSGLFFALLSAISVSYLVFNFFSAVKVERMGLPYEALTFIILGYSTVELLAPTIISHIKNRNRILPLFLALSAAGFLGLYRLDNFFTLPFMLILPLILSVTSTLSNEAINKSIDRHGLSKKRATVLSIFNIGNSLLEVLFLAGSALLSDDEGNIAFLFVAVYTAFVFLLLLFQRLMKNLR